MMRYIALFLWILTECVSMALAFFHKSLCKDDEFYLGHTGNCESCLLICDPINMHKSDCPRLCPKYTITTPTTSTTTTTVATTTFPLDILEYKKSFARNWFTELLTNIYFIIVIVVVFIILLTLLLGCICFKKRTSLKTRWPLRICFNELNTQPTFNAEQPTDEHYLAARYDKDENDENKPLNGNDDNDQNFEEHELNQVLVDNHENDKHEQNENQPQNGNND